MHKQVSWKKIKITKSYIKNIYNTEKFEDTKVRCKRMRIVIAGPYNEVLGLKKVAPRCIIKKNK